MLIAVCCWLIYLSLTHAHAAMLMQIKPVLLQYHHPLKRPVNLNTHLNGIHLIPNANGANVFRFASNCVNMACCRTAQQAIVLFAVMHGSACVHHNTDTWAQH